jgi:hypothetical protein
LARKKAAREAQAQAERLAEQQAATPPAA